MSTELSMKVISRSDNIVVDTFVDTLHAVVLILQE